jgi:hypothetical protein
MRLVIEKSSMKERTSKTILGLIETSLVLMED